MTPPIQRIKQHLALSIASRNKAMVARRQHNPMIVRVGSKGRGHSGTKSNLPDEMATARTKLSRLVWKFTRGEVQEKTLKAAEIQYITLIRKSREAMERMNGCDASVEHWEGAVQSLEMVVDTLELASARFRRVS